MKREKQSGKSTAKFLGTILLCALLGGVAGYCAAANGDALENVLNQGKMLVQQLGIWWFLPGFVILFLGWVLYGKTKKLIAQTGEDDEVFQRCNRILGRCMLCSGGATPLFVPRPGGLYHRLGDRHRTHRSARSPCLLCGKSGRAAVAF